MHRDMPITPPYELSTYNPQQEIASYVNYLNIGLFSQFDRLVTGDSHPLRPWQPIINGLLHLVPQQRMASEDIWYHLSKHPEAENVYDPRVKASLKFVTRAGIAKVRPPPTYPPWPLEAQPPARNYEYGTAQQQTVPTTNSPPRLPATF